MENGASRGFVFRVGVAYGGGSAGADAGVGISSSKEWCVWVAVFVDDGSGVVPVCVLLLPWLQLDNVSRSFHSTPKRSASCQTSSTRKLAMIFSSGDDVEPEAFRAVGGRVSWSESGGSRGMSV